MRAMLTEPESHKPVPFRVHVARVVGFVILWTLVTLSAQAVARPALLWLRAPWSGMVAGLLTGLLQWSALGLAPTNTPCPNGTPEDALPGSGWWIAATGIAMGLASLLQGRIAMEPAAILTASLVGLAQWLVLRRRGRWSALWIPVCAAVAWPAASFSLAAVAWLSLRNSLLVAQVLAGALQGALVGAATGLVLATLLPGASGWIPENPTSEVH